MTFWDGETWPKLKGCWWLPTFKTIKRSRLESPGMEHIYLYMNGWILHVFLNVGKYTVGPMDDMVIQIPVCLKPGRFGSHWPFEAIYSQEDFHHSPGNLGDRQKRGGDMILVGWCTSRNLVHYVCFRFGRTLYDLFDLVDLHCGKLIPWFTRVFSTIPGGCLGCLNHQLYVGSTWRIIPFISHLGHSEGE